LRIFKFTFVGLVATGFISIPGCGSSGNSVVEPIAGEVEVSPEVQQLDEQEAAQR
jgi:hypothetical protein